MQNQFRHRRGFAPSREVRETIARLDAKTDAQRIVQLLLSDEFPFDIVRANELALFHTFGSRSISTLLDRTGQFSRAGQKRYDDTRLLIGHILECGLDDEVGARALAHMNRIHSHYRIPNEDFVFVLWTFIDFPIQWLGEFGHRALTPHEQTAWFNCWVRIGERMGLRDIPADKATFDAFAEAYEQREFIPCEASRGVADATTKVMKAWLPSPLRWLVDPVAASLMRPRLRQTLGYAEPPKWLSLMLRATLRIRRVVKRVFSLEKYPGLMSDTLNRTYPGNRYEIEHLGPFNAAAGNRADTSSPAASSASR
ncbi:MAG: oxygenase MpaB family protein [Archangium sp.]